MLEDPKITFKTDRQNELGCSNTFQHPEHHAASRSITRNGAILGLAPREKPCPDTARLVDQANGRPLDRDITPGVTGPNPLPSKAKQPSRLWWIGPMTTALP